MRNKRSAPKPVLLMLVYGVFLVLVGITATAQAILVSAHFTASTLNGIVGSDAATVRTFVNGLLTPSDLDPLTLAPAARKVRAEEIADKLGALVDRAQILHVEIRSPAGKVLYSEDPSAVNQQGLPSATFAEAVKGSVQADILPIDPHVGGPQASAEALGAPLPVSDVIREFLPLQVDGQTVAVVGFWHDAAPALTRIEESRRAIVLVTVSAALIVSVLLFFIFRAAQSRISKQTQQLIESTRIDPLTGMPNHGTLVEQLNEVLEASRRDGKRCAVALVDIDNFRLLNETHGHAAGDAALLAVADAVRATARDGTTCGRYGPDEFLIVAAGTAAANLQATVEDLRMRVAEGSLQFGNSERLPITVSIGAAYAPDHAQAATELLSVAAHTLADAKAGGGDRILLAQTTGQEMKVAARSRFEVLQGLVLAIDARDRYTKRHSEDVARYALFIADRMALDADARRSIHAAGLLHDVGKIGIPDDILRKPGRLTQDEIAIVQQHVALGDAIVRDLPDVDAIRAGIRHHHEAWDGRGYLDHLSGEEIPLVARILAVGDAFSAMTTTRPYRKALSVEEAIRRLGDAAGSQLDERLVRIFIEGFEAAADPPMPGVPAPYLRLLAPAGAEVQVA